MSKIFDALRNTADNDGLSAFSFIGECDTTPESSATVVATQTEPAPVPAVSQAPAPAPASVSTSAARSMPLRIASPSPLLPFEDSHWYAGEQYRIVRTKILQHPLRPRMILVSSSGTGDGKSVSAINLAGVLSLKSDSKVLLVEGDLRRPTIFSQLGIPKSPGLGDVLKGTCALEEALIHPEQLPNLYILTAGDPIANPAEALDSAKWRQLTATVRQMFAHVIVDSPPVGKVADFDLLQAVCDGIVVVVRPDHTSRKLCLEALKIVEQNKLLGVLMNCTKNWFLSGSSNYDGDYYYHSQSK